MKNIKELDSAWLQDEAVRGVSTRGRLKLDEVQRVNLRGKFLVLILTMYIGFLYK